ncbi:MAG: hypothetical protein M3N47_14320 [Chloroflexota bacterium]|nr:hypothetical protein [Chloroflexota bacterium]
MRAALLSGTKPVAAAVVLVAWLPTAAVAHGPCGCVAPRVIEAGGQIRIVSPARSGSREGRSYPAYRVLFNPRPDDLGIAPRYLASAHRRDVPTRTVLDRPRRQATRNARFRVPPKTPPGLYMVLIFDGGEGGAHNTWDYVHVIDPDEEDQAGVVASQSERPTTRTAHRAATDGGPPDTARWPLLGGVGLACLLIAAVGGAVARRRRATGTPRS